MNLAGDCRSKIKNKTVATIRIKNDCNGQSCIQALLSQNSGVGIVAGAGAIGTGGDAGVVGAGAGAGAGVVGTGGVTASGGIGVSTDVSGFLMVVGSGRS